MIQLEILYSAGSLFLFNYRRELNGEILRCDEKDNRVIALLVFYDVVSAIDQMERSISICDIDIDTTQIEEYLEILWVLSKRLYQYWNIIIAIELNV
ncbi:hypothetical protein BJP49_06185 [Paenibacillus odorifer]|uniref:hypothetical protein n=1 Tax=Paenibacillus odorifer TaxID=189426 RepID=UPI00096C58CA|nr:hypothetical protein [Paenibacillus odorifer]OMD00709.1 hypothetical protein BJP49_06185 [Paenibacillus odorifer]OME28214.1 hypothetical protein BSK57_00395 [Paenibacillus odorifer]OME35211.1 hypothetical protein BSK63_06875 [Paenibacillus odorifer]OME42614.1 hypothetical protein BSK46_02100 [Paenibacillus odorifer]